VAVSNHVEGAEYKLCSTLWCSFPFLLFIWCISVGQRNNRVRNCIHLCISLLPIRLSHWQPCVTR